MYQQIKEAQEKLDGLPRSSILPKGGVSAFLGASRYAVRLTFTEKEVCFFAFMQWVTICFAYILWLQGFHLVPEHVVVTGDGEAHLPWWVNAAAIAWGLFCIALASIPVGFFTGCMGAVHFLYRSNRQSTVAQCIQVSAGRAAPLSMFHFIDGCITVKQLLERTNKDQRSAVSEGLYYTWKLAVAGILPAILTGKGREVTFRAVAFIRDNFASVLLLRGGYSLLCWGLGLATFAAALAVGRSASIDLEPNLMEGLYQVYVVVGIPGLVGVAVLMLVLRPIYVLALCELYSRHMDAIGSQADLPVTPPTSVNIVMMVVAGVITILSIAIIVLLAGMQLW